jgi:hypothetical protein
LQASQQSGSSVSPAGLTKNTAGVKHPAATNELGVGEP